MGPVMARFDQVASTTGAALMIIHHNGKDAAKGRADGRPAERGHDRTGGDERTDAWNGQRANAGDLAAGRAAGVHLKELLARFELAALRGGWDDLPALLRGETPPRRVITATLPKIRRSTG